MADLTVVPKRVRPLLGAITRPYNAGGVVNVGDPVYIAADGDIEQADNVALASAKAIGVVVSIGAYGALVAAAGDRCDVTVFGPVGFGGTTLTPGAPVYTSATAGKIESAAAGTGAFLWYIGYGEVISGETVIFINPWTHDIAAQS